MPSNDGGLGEHLVGDKIPVGERNLQVVKLLGEGGFSYVYLVDSQDANGKDEPQLVLKVTSIHSRSQRDIAEKEAKLLSRLSHPSIIKMYDTCYRSVAHNTKKSSKDAPTSSKERPQHLILMEFCEGGHALDVCNTLAAAGQRFDLSTLIIAFGQICNAVSYLHAQRPPIVHRDLKPVNFLVKNGAYKLCDFGSAVFGHVDLKSSKARAEAEEVIQKTTTQMFRAPEMVDLYMTKKLTQSTDVWALGCCLYSLAFLKNCFEEGSNLAILSGKYTIPDDNPYGDGLVELLDRMLTADCKARADMTEVILCLSAVYSGRPLPPRKKASKAKESKASEPSAKTEEDKVEKPDSEARIGSYRTDGQGTQEAVYDPTKKKEGKKLKANSAAARRRAAATASTAPTSPKKSETEEADLDFSSFPASKNGSDDFAFSADFGGFDTKGDEFFGSSNAFTDSTSDSKNAFDATFDTGAWGEQTPQEPEQKEKSRKKKSSRSSKSSSLEAGMDGMDINADGKDKKERKSRSSKSGDDEDKAKRSGSRSRRKPSRSKSDKPGDDKKVKKGNSFRLKSDS